MIKFTITVRTTYIFQISFFCIVFVFSIQAQNEANIWHFCEEAGLDFNDGYPPTVLNVPYFNAAYGSSVMSDSAGNLLFSVGDRTIWNLYGEVMLNGDEIMGWPGGAQYALIVTKPNSKYLYYVFTVGNADTQNPGGLWYSVVDMNLDNGNGAVTEEKNVLLEAAFDARDKLIGFKGLNNDYKIITYKVLTDEYAVFTLTNLGINDEPVLSPSMTRNYNIGKEGSMKLSYEKKHLVSAFSNNNASDQEDAFEVCSYNIETDSIKYMYMIKPIPDGGDPYTIPNSVEFSPDSKWLYLCDYLHEQNPNHRVMHLFQYDMQYINDSSQFVESEILIDSGFMSGLQLARDGKIYLARGTSYGSRDHLSIIHEPWKKGLDCNYQENALYIGYEKVDHFLTNMVLDYLYRFEFEGNCSSDPFYFKSNFIPEPKNIRWSFNDPNSGADSISFDINPVHYFTQGGEYEVKVVVEYPSARIERTSRLVTVTFNPKPDLGPDTLMCSQGEITLNAGDEEGIYVWSDGTLGENANEIIVSDTGWYWVQVTNDEGCFGIDSIHVGLYPPPEIDETDLHLIPTSCGGSNGKILGLKISGEEPLTFEWYDADSILIATTLDIIDLPVGNYYLHILDGNDCITISEPYTIEDAGDIEITTVETENTHCYQNLGAIRIGATSLATDYLLYSIDNGNTWQDNDSLFQNLPQGSYVIRVSDTSGCESVYENNPVIINNTLGPQITDLLITPEIDYLQNGQIEIMATTTEGQLHYSNDNGTNFQTDNGLFSNLTAGIYDCMVKDDFGCDTTFTVEVERIISQLIEAIAGDGNTCIGNAAVVPLKLNNFKDIYKFHVKLTYDTTILNCDGYMNVYPNLENNIQVSIIPGTDEVLVNWQGDTPETLEDQATMLELVFGAKEEGLSGIDWAAGEGESAFFNEQLEEVNADYHLGKLRVFTRPFIIMPGEHNKCEGEFFVAYPLVTGGSGEVTYEWTGPDDFHSTNKSITIQNLTQEKAGIYTLVVTDTVDCAESMDVSVIVNPNPIITFPEEDTIYVEPNFILETGSNDQTYLWSIGDTTNNIQITEEGLYSVIVTSTENCTATDSVTILFSGEPFFMPNAFSPNDDGLNDEFRPVRRYDYIKTYHLSIYNRWGQIIFETKDIEQGWDGMYNGHLSPNGTYVYKIVYKAHSTGDETQTKTGQLTLVR